jgi:hypothetical protein
MHPIALVEWVGLSIYFQAILSRGEMLADQVRRKGGSLPCVGRQLLVDFGGATNRASKF